METKFNFVKCLLVGMIVGMVVLGGGCGGLIKVGTAKDATPPAIQFTTSPELGVVPVVVRFDASATSDSESLISSYSWDFDGDSKEDSTAQTATFTYQQPGVYYPRLKVVNSEGLVSYSTGSEIVANDKVYIRIETDKEVYKIGEDVKMSFTIVNTDNEDFVKPRSGWRIFEWVIYNSNGEAVWKYDDSTVSDWLSNEIRVLSTSELNCSRLDHPYPCPWLWHQNYGYESIFALFPEMYFSEYKGDIEKLRKRVPVTADIYLLRLDFLKQYYSFWEDGKSRYVWGIKKIKIERNF